MLKNKLLTVIALLSVLVLVIKPFNVAAQEDNLKTLEGYYEFQQHKNTYLQFTSRGKQLMLTQLWDGKELLFDKKSELFFVNKEMPWFTLEFKKDNTGAVNQVIAMGKDVWDKKKDYTPPKVEILSEAETALLKRNLRNIADAYEEAINSNSPDQITAFINKYADENLQRSADQLINPARNTYRSTGGIDFYAESSFMPGKRTVSYLFKGKILGNFYELRFAVNKNNKIILVENQEVQAPVIPKKKFNSEQELIASLQQTLSALDQKAVFSGTVLLAKGNRILMEYACGEAVKPKHIKNTIHTKFNLGSINKMFTAISIMQLMEQGKLKLQDPISMYIDSTWLPRKITDKVTIHHLLSHSSGLGDFFGEKFSRTPQDSILELADYKPFINENTLAFEPGSSWSYSNSGMILLGVIIEKVSHMNYFDYVRQKIYEPAGMSRTDCYKRANHQADVAHGYIPQADGSYEDNLNFSGYRGSSAGGGYSTVGDLHRFALALHSRKLVSAATLKLMFTDHFNRQYGYGFQLQNSPSGKVVGHTGGAPGINGALFSVPEKDYHIVVLTNYDRAAQRVANYLLEMIP